MKQLFTLLLALFFINIIAQNNAINGAKTVDYFTGSFTYSVPLISIPSPDGPSVSISTSYRSGIKTNQESSKIGLGWDISFGEIFKQVNGYPDDWKGVWQKVYEAGYLNGSKVEVHYFYNSTTGQYANPFIRAGKWSSSVLK